MPGETLTEHIEALQIQAALTIMNEHANGFALHLFCYAALFLLLHRALFLSRLPLSLSVLFGLSLSPSSSFMLVNPYTLHFQTFAHILTQPYTDTCTFRTYEVIKLTVSKHVRRLIHSLTHIHH